MGKYLKLDYLEGGEERFNGYRSRKEKNPRFGLQDVKLDHVSVARYIDLKELSSCRAAPMEALSQFLSTWGV